MTRAQATAKQAVAVGVAALLLVVGAAPVEARWRAGFWIGFGTGALLTAPFWWSPYPYAYSYAYPYAYPYGYPYYEPYPVYVYPAPPAGIVPPAVPYPSPTTPTPSPLTPSLPSAAAPTPPGTAESGIARQCETVWVEGHYETHTWPGGQVSTVWVPTASRQICHETGRP